MTYRQISSGLRLMLCATLVVATVPATWAEDAAPAVDAALSNLLKQDPAALVEKIKGMKAATAKQDAEAAALRKKATELTNKATELEGTIAGLMEHVKALSKKYKVGPVAVAMKKGAAVKMAVAPAEKPSVALTNFADHVMPIFQARCARCHNADKAKSGLNLATLGTTLEGGSSGPSIVPGDPDGSRLMALITQAEEPFMPPSGDPLTPEQIEIIRKWIADGAPANGKSKGMAKKAVAKDDNPVFVAASFDGPPPMPEVALAKPNVLPGRGVVARAVDTSPRSPLMAVGGDRQVLLYQTDTNELLGALPFPEGDIFTLTFSINGELLLAGGGQEGDTGISVLWNIKTGERLGTYGQYYDTVLAADISPDHRMIALGGPSKKVRVYSTETGEELYALEKHNDWVYAGKFTPDGEVLASADRAGGMYLWQAANGREVEQLRGHNGAINALAYTADSKVLASVGDDGTVQLWDTWKYKRIRSFKAHNKAALYVDISADSRIITAGADRQTKIWGLDGKEQKAFKGSGDWVYAACFGLNNRVVGGTWSGNIIMWDAVSGEEVAKLSTNPAPEGKA
ncbi:MAG: hypothetical protein L3K26_16300 [Candidatus Hydrogenedentes bacterium]|nr:hypothetical protein [Candidatus Hydrogenedentota bacterium]